MSDPAVRLEARTSDASMWHVCLHTMAGRVFHVQCPQQALTSVADMKRAVESQDAEFPANRLSLTVRPIDGAASSVEHDESLVLQDHQTLHQCGLGNRAAFNVLLPDIAWRPRDRELQDKVMAGGQALSITDNWNGDGCRECLDAESGAAIAWALTVRFFTFRKNRTCAYF
jgi:hypothetical protein